jgi:hypothetical protein
MSFQLVFKKACTFGYTLFLYLSKTYKEFNILLHLNL